MTATTSAAAATGSAISSHLAVRKDWLARRHEAPLDPRLPIIDPHHHLIDRPESGHLPVAPTCWRISPAAHNIVATVYLEWLSMYRAAGPQEMRPVGEIEFANGVAAMSASGGLRHPARLCRPSLATPTSFLARTTWPRYWRR